MTNIYPTQHYEANGIPFCPVCGDQYHSDDFGIFCPGSEPTCKYTRIPANPSPAQTASAKTTKKPEVKEESSGK